MKRITEHLAANPRILFGIDAFGALLTAFLTGIVWMNFQQYIGMPPVVLKVLTIIAVILCIYSGACFLFVKNTWPSFIKAIAMANLLYSVLSLCLAGINYSALTMPGIVYFSGEIVIISLLVWLEFKVLAAVSKGEKSWR